MSAEIDEQEIDLDEFLGRRPSDQGSSRNKDPLGSYEKPESDRICVVGMFVDDSGSLGDLAEAVVGGIKLGVKAFRGAKGCDFYLYVEGFKQIYYKGLLRNLKSDSFSEYRPDYGESPIVSHSMRQLNELYEIASRYRQSGIQATIAQLILTDGDPNCDDPPEAFKKVIEKATYVVGMGITRGDADRQIARYSDFFRAMGVTKFITPKSDPAEVRHAINEFSQSVAAIAGQ